MDDTLLRPMAMSGPAVDRDNKIKELAACETCANFYSDVGYTFCGRTGGFAVTERMSSCGERAKFYVPGRGD
jgi:hypothetical protein